jgi:hypothetical protein
VRVDHERQPGGPDRVHHPQQVAVVVHAGAGGMRVLALGVDDHEDLERADAALGHREDLGRVGRGRVVVVVDDRLGGVQLEHLVEQLRARGRRLEIGHAEDRRHTARGGRAAGRGDVLLVREPGLARVHVRVDHPRQDEPAGRVERPPDVGDLQAGLDDAGDPAVAHQHVGAAAAVRRHHVAPGDAEIDGHQLSSLSSIVSCSPSPLRTTTPAARTYRSNQSTMSGVTLVQ